jgi:threonine aldolase
MPAPGLVDLRSDTLTVPDSGMRAAMARAEVGDDVWGEDSTVRRLEAEMARLLGKEAAVYVPSGTMGNLTCVAAQTRPGDEVIADTQAHVVVYEVGGTAIVAGIQLRVLDSVDGVPDAESIAAAIRSDDIHQPVSTLLCIENTHNRRGGAAIDTTRLHAATRAAHGHGLRGASARGSGVIAAAGLYALEHNIAEAPRAADVIAGCSAPERGVSAAGVT